MSDSAIADADRAWSTLFRVGVVAACLVTSRSAASGRGGRGRLGISRLRSAAAVLLLVAFATGCRSEKNGSPDDLAPSGPCDVLRLDASAGAHEPRGVVFVLNDTMRRDALSRYGGRVRTPRLDAFADEHLAFDRTVSQAPWTKPSIATLFTSLHPSQHRVESHPQLDGRGRGSDGAVEADVLAPSIVTLAESLQAAGVRTAAFVANPWLVRPFGFDQGFETFDASFARWGATGDQVVEAGLEWLDRLPDDAPFFLYLHTIDSHRPYGKIPVDDFEATRARLNEGQPLPQGEGRRFAGSIRVEDGRRAKRAGLAPTDALIQEAYLRGVERFDAIFGMLLDELAARPALDARTGVIVTSDHGEALFERGYGNHGGALFEEDVAVPLFARLPGVAPSRGATECEVGLIDLMPTLCDYYGVACPARAQGWSLFTSEAESEGAAARSRYLASEGVMYNERDRSIRSRRYKLVRRPRVAAHDDPAAGYALYDLETDALERVDLLHQPSVSPEALRVFEVLRPQLDTAVHPMDRAEHGTARIDDEVRRQLEALGYGQAPRTR